MFGAVLGYSASREKSDSRAALFSALFFIVGTIGSLVVIGAMASVAGEVAQTSLGRYGKLIAGMIVIFFGLASLKLLPFKLGGRRTTTQESKPKGLAGAAVLGFALGGGVGVCSMCCNPGIFVVLGVVIMKGYSLWSIAMLTAYAIGFSLPLAGIILGVSLGKMNLRAKKLESAVRTMAGVLLIVAGFYFLATI
jgi:cytochrome c-type biogenesis protein